MPPATLAVTLFERPAELQDVELEWFSRGFDGVFLRQQGMAFQDFFADVMEASLPGDFERLRAYGNRGDLKCDGRLRSRGIIFQVYAPREMKLAALQRKIGDDFSGAKRDWKKERYFETHSDPLFGDEVAAVFRAEYQRLRSERLRPDHIFAALQAFAGGSTRGETEHEAAILAVLSYLFDRCDIFEAPRKGTEP